MNDYYIHLLFAFLLISYFYRLWFINNKRGKEKQLLRSNHLIYYSTSQSDSNELRKLKRKINLLTTIIYIIMVVLTLLIIRQKMI